MKNSFATIVNGLSVLNFFQLSNGDFYFRSMPTTPTKCVKLNDELRAGIEVRIDFFGYTLGVGIIQTRHKLRFRFSRPFFFIPGSLF